MKDKLLKKLFSIVKDSKVKYWNGKFIKTIVVGSSDSKVFQVNSNKYKLELSVENRCDNTTNFIPSIPVSKLIDWRTGYLYQGNKEITAYFRQFESDIKEIDIADLYYPMFVEVLYTKEEIEECKSDYQRFLVQFKEDFCLND